MDRPTSVRNVRMVTTANFGFLRVHDPNLVSLGGLAERYFRDDPPTCLIKLRQFAELFSKLIAAHHALYIGERESFEDTLRRLSFERILPREVADLFHHLRKLGNAAAHEVSTWPSSESRGPMEKSRGSLRC